MKGWHLLDITTHDGKPVWSKLRLSEGSTDYLTCEIFVEEKRKLWGIELNLTKKVELDIPYDCNNFINVNKTEGWQFEDFNEFCMMAAKDVLEEYKNKDIKTKQRLDITNRFRKDW